MFGWLFGIDDLCGDPAKWSRGHLQDSLAHADRDRLGMLETINALQDEIDALLSEIDLLKAAAQIEPIKDVCGDPKWSSTQSADVTAERETTDRLYKLLDELRHEIELQKTVNHLALIGAVERERQFAGLSPSDLMKRPPQCRKRAKAPAHG